MRVGAMSAAAPRMTRRRSWLASAVTRGGATGSTGSAGGAVRVVRVSSDMSVPQATDFSISDLALLSEPAMSPLVRAFEMPDWRARLTWGYLGVTGRGVPPVKTSFSLAMNGFAWASAGWS